MNTYAEYKQRFSQIHAAGVAALKQIENALETCLKQADATHSTCMDGCVDEQAGVDPVCAEACLNAYKHDKETCENAAEDAKKALSASQEAQLDALEEEARKSLVMLSHLILADQKLESIAKKQQSGSFHDAPILYFKTFEDLKNELAHDRFVNVLKIVVRAKRGGIQLGGKREMLDPLATEWESSIKTEVSDTLIFAGLSDGDELEDTERFRELLKAGEVKQEFEKEDKNNLIVDSLKLMDLDKKPLRFFSASACDNGCGGNPRVLGTISISGDKDDALMELFLEIVEKGTVVAIAALAPGSAKKLLGAFGPDGNLSLDTPTKLFELSSEEATKISQTNDARLTLRVRARSEAGDEATREYGKVPKLVLYTNSNRYGPRDADKGGDSWVKPSVKAVVESLGSDYRWSDFSNMHGGDFFIKNPNKPPHASHDRGNDVDGVFADGTIEADWKKDKHHTAITAQRLIDILNTPIIGPRFVSIGLLYTKSATDPFWNTIKDVKLVDGRKATDIIKPWPGHDKHFHMRISDVADKRYKKSTDSLPDGVP